MLISSCRAIRFKLPSFLSPSTSTKAATAAPVLKESSSTSRGGVDGARSLAERLDEGPGADIPLDVADQLRARGVLRYNYAYEPPADLKTRVRKLLATVDDGDAALTKEDKLRVLSALAADLKHAVPNSELHRIRSLNDVVDFYQKSVQPTFAYNKLARAQNNPKNVFVAEEATRFHPDDKDAYHGGISAYPGQDGKVFSLRQRRLRREFSARKTWFDYEDVNFPENESQRQAEGMPWDPEVAAKMDAYPMRRYMNKSRTLKHEQ